MTMENDHGNFTPTPPRKSYNPFESDDETLDTLGMDSKVGFDLKEFEQSASPLTFLVDNDDSLWKDGDQPYDKNVTTVYELPEPLVSKDIGVDEGAKKVSHDQLDVLEAPKPMLKNDNRNDSALYPNEDKHMDGLYQDVQSGKCKVHEDKLMKKTRNESDKEQNMLVQSHEVMNPNEENQSTKSNNNIVNSNPRKQEDNLQSATEHEQPSLVTFSGPINYAGSVSIRSESSATSTGSFAFPRLQNEWNSSPVRMAKADRRRYKNRRRWLMAIICCRSF